MYIHQVSLLHATVDNVLIRRFDVCRQVILPSQLFMACSTSYVFPQSYALSQIHYQISVKDSEFLAEAVAWGLITLRPT